MIGSTATFVANAIGTPPLNWQWQFNTTNIDGATNATLVLSDVTLDQAGTYSVTVTNEASGELSSNAVLSIFVPPPTLDSFSVTADNQILFTIDGVPGLNYAVEASTDLVNWDSIETNVSPFDFTDTNTASFPQRFYRAIYLP